MLGVKMCAKTDFLDGVYHIENVYQLSISFLHGTIS